MTDIRDLAIYHDPANKPLVDKIERLRAALKEIMDDERTGLTAAEIAHRVLGGS